MEPSVIGEFFHFSRKERIGILFLLSILILLYALPEWMYRTHKEHKHIGTESDLFIEKLEAYDVNSGINVATPSFKMGANENSVLMDDLFLFDPNTLDSAGFLRLGLRSSAIRILLKYRNKGGRFHRPEDFSKLYGITEKEKSRLIPYVRIQDTNIDKVPYRRDSFAVKKVNRSININVADSSQWDALPGIGPVLSVRIMRYRDRLGGFYKLEQVKETYGITDSVFEQIRPFLYIEVLTYRKLKVNLATAEELARHPYIGRALSKEIIAYRQSNGHFRDTADLYRLVSRTPSDIQRALPYMDIENN